MVDDILATCMDNGSQRSPSNFQAESQFATDVLDELPSQVPYMFDMADSTWPNVYLFGPVGRSFGAFIHREQKRHYSSTSAATSPTAPTYTSASTSTSDSTSSSSLSWSAVLEVYAASNAPPSYIDIRASLQSSADDLIKLHGAYQVEKVRPCGSQAAERYLDFLLRLESFLFFLLWHRVPSFIHANLLRDLHELHRDTFRPSSLTFREPVASEKLRAQDLWDRRRAYQQGYSHRGEPAPIPPDVTVAILPEDWRDPRVACRDAADYDVSRKVGIFSRSHVVVFGSFLPVPADLKRTVLKRTMGPDVDDGDGQVPVKRARMDLVFALAPSDGVVSYKERPRAGATAPPSALTPNPTPILNSSAPRTSSVESRLNSLLRRTGNLDSTLVNREPAAPVLHCNSTALALDRSCSSRRTSTSLDSTMQNPTWTRDDMTALLIHSRKLDSTRESIPNNPDYIAHARNSTVLPADHDSQSTLELASTGKSTARDSVARNSSLDSATLDSIAHDSSSLVSTVDSTHDSAALDSTAVETGIEPGPASSTLDSAGMDSSRSGALDSTLRSARDSTALDLTLVSSTHPHPEVVHPNPDSVHPYPDSDHEAESGHPDPHAELDLEPARLPFSEMQMRTQPQKQWNGHGEAGTSKVDGENQKQDEDEAVSVGADPTKGACSGATTSTRPACVSGKSQPAANSTAASASPPPLARSSRDVSTHTDGAKTKTRTKTKQHKLPPVQNMHTPPIIPFAQNIPAAPGAPLILGAGCVMTFEASQAHRAFGAETRRGDAEALVEWFSMHTRGGQRNVEWVRYLREVLWVAGPGLTPSRSDTGAATAASSYSSPPSSLEGTTSLGLVLERVADAPRPFGDATLHDDGRAVRAFLKTRPASEVGRYVQYLRAVLGEVECGLAEDAGEGLG
ncbi:hypothetical protein B0H11DRAFT_2061769 [Mycena galericulata]|nr:hypothetical protein B0H11DRAFT_2061769 [Mycena galericulata]